MSGEKQALYDLIKEAFLLLDFGDRRLLEQYRLTVSRYYALHHIASRPGLSPGQLSHLMFCDKSNITRIVQSLETDGYLERQMHERDARAQRLYLTASGARLHDDVALAHAAYVEQRLNSLPQPDTARMADGLAYLIRSLAADLVK